MLFPRVLINALTDRLQSLIRHRALIRVLVRMRHPSQSSSMMTVDRWRCLPLILASTLLLLVCNQLLVYAPLHVMAATSRKYPHATYCAAASAILGTVCFASVFDCGL